MWASNHMFFHSMFFLFYIMQVFFVQVFHRLFYTYISLIRVVCFVKKYLEISFVKEFATMLVVDISFIIISLLFIIL